MSSNSICSSPSVVEQAMPAGLRNPWKSLQAYTEDDRAVFFGRSRESEEFLTLVRRDILSILFARSGLGKTSLLRAGIIPQLRDEGFFPVYLRLDYRAAMPTGRQILDATVAAATMVGIKVEEGEKTMSTTAPDYEQETLWEFFHRHEFWGPRNDFVPPVLILDQFEELFTLGQGQHATEFLDQLADLVENRMPRRVRERIETTGIRLPFDTRASNYKVIISLREDFVSRLDSLRPSMPAVMGNRFALTPLSWDRSVEVICRAGGHWVSETVARDIVAAVANISEPREGLRDDHYAEAEIEPAYLSVMCHELFRRMVELNRSEIGSDLVAAETGNILDAFYERSFKDLAAGTRCFVEDRLLTTSGFRAAVPVPEAERDVSSAELHTLVERRLLRFEPRFGVPHVELSHDLLIRLVQKSRDRRAVEATRAADQRRADELRAQLRRTVRRAWAGVAAVVLLLGAIDFMYLGWWHPNVSYARNFTKRWGKIHPVGPLSESAVEHRAWTLRITREGWFGDVQTMEVIDSNRRLTGKHDIRTYLTGSEAPQTQREKESKYQFVYDRAGCVAYEIARNRFGTIVWGFVYAPVQREAAADVPTAGATAWHAISEYIGPTECPRGQATATYVGYDGLPQPQGNSRAEFIDIHYDRHGFEDELHYRDRLGRLMPGPDNAYGRYQEYDEQGRLVRQTSLDEREQPMNDEVGNASEEAQYDQDGNVVESRFLDAKGEPTLIKGNVYRIRHEYDQWGRLTEVIFYGLAGEPAVDDDQTGAHRITWNYDNRGNIKSIKLFDQSNRPVVAGKKFFDIPAHEQQATFDSQNRVETVTYFDQVGKPLTAAEGWHGYRLEYDNNGFLAAISYLDAAGHPVCQRKSGVGRITRKNDLFGQADEERYFDAEGVPVATRDGGYHLRRNKYDQAGNLVEQTYFDIHDKPVADKIDGVYRVVWSYNRFQNVVRIEYFDENGPIDSKLGFHRQLNTYDGHGSMIGSRWEDKHDHHCNGPDGVPRVRYEYDQRGLLVRLTLLDAKGQPTVGADGIYELLFEYNDKRQQTKWQFFGLNRIPAENKAGNHLIVRDFNERGRETGMTWLRADGGPNLDRELRVATQRWRFDKENRQIEQAYYDEKGNLVVGPAGFAKNTITYLPDGRVEFRNFGTNGKLADNALVGYAIKKTDSRQRGETTEAYYGPDGALIFGPEGFAEAHYTWSDDGTLVNAAWFGPDGTPVAGPGGYQRMERAPGSASATTKYFDAQGNELRSLGADMISPVIVIDEISDIKQPAAKAGLRAGDIFWKYGDWSFPKALALEQAKGTPSEEMVPAAAQAFSVECNRRSRESVRMTVIRNGNILMLTIPPLPDQDLGASPKQRLVPTDMYKKWQAADDDTR